MKRAILPLLILLAATASAAQESGVGGIQTPQQPEETIWALEELYSAYHRDANHDGVLSIWHDQFLGWPDPEPQPANKEQGARYLRREFPTPASLTFHIQREGIRILGDVVINYYTLHTLSKDEDGREQRRSVRVTHTWIKEEGQWRLLGGMSNNQ